LLGAVDESVGFGTFNHFRAFAASESDLVGESCLDRGEGEEERGRDGDVCLDGEYGDFGILGALTLLWLDRERLRRAEDGRNMRRGWVGSSFFCLVRVRPSLEGEAEE